jgi:hypothetical protein
MQGAKIQLSEEETALVLNPGWILTKRSIMEKTGLLLGDLAAHYQALIRDRSGINAELKDRFPKLSKGENYKGLPYMILDYPAVFDKTDVFAIRTFFWWGNYFSLTLHLKGRYQREYQRAALDGIQRSPYGDWHVSISEDEWVHAVLPGDYAPHGYLVPEVRQALEGRPFFKVVTVIPLEQWEKIPSLLSDRFFEILQWLE